MQSAAEVSPTIPEAPGIYRYDGIASRFTGQYRDPESTLDWFQVRHMSGAQGRFQSVDPGNAGADPSNPQTWNAYAYVGNNPLSYTDPSGELGLATEVGSSFGPIGFAIGAHGSTLASLFGISSEAAGATRPPWPI